MNTLFSFSHHRNGVEKEFFKAGRRFRLILMNKQLVADVTETV